MFRHLRGQVTRKLDLDPGDFDLQLVAYGYDALAPIGQHDPAPDREVGLVFTATAADQATATEIARLANPVLLHAPLPDAASLPSYALLGSPAEFERGQVHEFVLCHAVDVDAPDELFRTRVDTVSGNHKPEGAQHA